MITENDEFDIPLNITDFIEVCKNYSNLGNYQTYIDQLAEDNEAKSVPINVIPGLIRFFDSISNNPYFGDARFASNKISKKLKLILNNYNKSLN
jgi:hypothetical protein